MLKKLLILILCIALFPITPAFAAQSEITWLKAPDADSTVSNYSYHVNEDSFYQRAQYAEGLYNVCVLQGELEYTALSPDGAGTFLTGCVDQQGQWIIPPVYNYGSSFSDGYAYVNQNTKEPINGGWSYGTVDRIIDKNGNVLSGIDQLVQQGYDIVAVQDGYVKLSFYDAATKSRCYGLASLTGDWIILPVFLDCNFPQNDLCFVQTANGYGYFNREGSLAITPQYQNAQDFSEGLAAVQQNGKWGFIDTTGAVQIDFLYDEVLPFEEGLAAVKMNHQWGFINKSGQVMIPVQYQAVNSFCEGVATVQQNSKWGCIDENGAVILPCKYEEVRSCSDGRIAVKWQGRYGYFDKNGEKIIDFLYGATTDFHEGLAIVSTGDFSNYTWPSFWQIRMKTVVYNNNRFGVIDRWGNRVLPEEYLCISDFADGTAICQRSSDYKVGIIQAPEVDAHDPGTRSFIRLYLNGKLLNTDQSPVLQQNRTLVPLRTVAEALSIDISWDEINKMVTVKTDTDTLNLPIDSTTAYLNGDGITLDVPATIVNGRTMVPLRFVAEQFQATVQWDGDSKIVTIHYM